MLIQEIRAVVQAGGKREIRSFGYLMGGILAAVAGFLYWKANPAMTWVGGISGFFLLSALALPVLLKPLYAVWMTFAVVMGFIMTRVILSVFYGLVMTPTGLIARMLGKDLLDQKYDTSRSSYWDVREVVEYDPVQTEKQY